MGRPKRFPVFLSEDEVAELKALVSKGVVGARVMTRARVLLLSHQEKRDRDVADALGITLTTVGNIRRRFVEGGLKRALHDLPRPGVPPLLNPKQIARLIAETCSEAPEGHAKWTMQLLADRIVTLGVVDSISDETVRRTLKKTRSNPGKSKAGVSPKEVQILPGGWTRCLTPRLIPMTRSTRWSASMKSQSSCLITSPLRFLPRRDSRRGRITNTNGVEQRICSLLLNR